MSRFGNKWGDDTNEPFNRLQAAVLSLSKGPVCPADAVGKSDSALIMRAAMVDGTLRALEWHGDACAGKRIST